MSHVKPISIIGEAFLDETFAQALLANPVQALANAHLSLAPEDVVLFEQGAVSLNDLARIVLEWEIATGRAEAPLRVPALERSRRSGEPDIRRTTLPDDKALAA